MLLLAETTGTAGGSWSYVKRRLLTGAAIVLPVALTVYITVLVVNFVSQFLVPGVFLVQDTLGVTDVPVVVIELATAFVFLAGTFAVGAVAESRRTDGALEQRFDAAFSSVPGIGSIYSNLNEISDLLMSQDTESFQEVKVVEFPHEGSFMLGFVTADHPTVMEEATGHRQMTTVFAPMGPNPFMGGFVLHLPEERVHEIDMSVEEGLQTIVSSGVVINDPQGADAAGEKL